MSIIKENPPSLQELVNRPIHYSDLPWDSQAAAHRRMTYDLVNKRTYDFIDSQVVLGDQSQGTSIISDLTNPKKAIQHLQESAKRSKAFLEQHKDYLKKRHEEYKKYIR
ncbi:hypothetical protein HOE04_04815 [archaeon]|jgi:hypothetical protein|nr:hypothetical protein [archaeon]